MSRFVPATCACTRGISCSITWTAYSNTMPPLATTTRADKMSLLLLDESALSRAGALHTAREIAQQPQCWLRTESLVTQRRSRIDEFLAPVLAHPDLRIILTGAGSSSF